MSGKIAITRTDCMPDEIRQLAANCKNGSQARRLLAIALVMDDDMQRQECHCSSNILVSDGAAAVANQDIRIDVHEVGLGLVGEVFLERNFADIIAESEHLAAQGLLRPCIGAP